jgi:DNA polymerase-3 subunit delta'
MHAFLIIGDSEQIITNRFSMPKIPFVLQKIDDVRELKKILKFKTNQKTAIVINNIDSATEEALNAFLKILEEPGENISFILTAKNLENVIPTVISRCEVITSHKSQVTSHKNNTQIQKFLNSKTTERIAIVEKIKEREEIIKFVEDLIFVERKKGDYKYMNNYLNILKNLKLNGNIGLQVLNLVVRMNSDVK